MFTFNRGKKTNAIIILDGWGIAPVWGGNAIGIAEVKTYNEIFRRFPSTMLQASGEFVGLPPGAPGNSEAGHLNIGAGSVVHQDQPTIDHAIENGTFFTNKVLLESIDHAIKNSSTIHLIGLLSKTGTHSQITHLYALLRLIKSKNYDRVVIHLFGDGRDSDSMSGIEMADDVINKCREIGVGRIASVIGRFFAMDRDNRWDRTRRTYDLLTKGIGKSYLSPGAVFTDSYAQGITDEFIEPSVIINKSSSAEVVSDNDTVIFFNFRADRAKELTRAFLDPILPELGEERRVLHNVYFATFVIHDENQLAKQAFFPETVIDPLAKILSDNNLRQYHTAETEKYAHVTYFLNGGSEKPFPGEDRLMIPSPKSVKTYDLLPEMSAGTVTDTLIGAINKHIYDFVIVNFANADMVGHTGNLKATVSAVEYVDRCLSRVLKEVLSNSGNAFVFADHGNAEQMVNPRTGTPDTEHTTNQVPFIIVSNDEKVQKMTLRKDGVLASIAPTIYEIAGIKFPTEGKERSLIERAA